MRGEKWKATELVTMVRQLQPGVIIDNRLEVSGEGFGSMWEGNPTPYHGDFVSPEQIIPPQGIQDKQGPGPGVGGLRHHEQQLGATASTTGSTSLPPCSSKSWWSASPRGATCS